MLSNVFTVWNIVFLCLSSGITEGSCVSEQHGCFQTRADRGGTGPAAAGVHRRLRLRVGRPDALLHDTHPPGLLQRSCGKPAELRCWKGVSLLYPAHFILACLCCFRQSMVPRFLMYQNCTANFIWETRAACAIRTINKDVSSPVWQHIPSHTVKRV